MCERARVSVSACVRGVPVLHGASVSAGATARARASEGEGLGLRLQLV